MPSRVLAALRDVDFQVPRVLSVAEAADQGMTRSAVAHAIACRGWQRLTRGLLLTVPGPPTRTDWINVGLYSAGPTGAISGWDAVRLAGLGEPQPPTDDVLVLCRSGRNRRIGGVRIRLTERPYRVWTLPAEHPELAFAPVVHTARAVADTALQYRRLAPVRALVTGAVQARKCEVEEMIEEVDGCPRNFSALVHRAVADLRAGARSVAEAEALDVLDRSPVPAFEANVDVVTTSGRTVATVDVLFRELRAVIEIDSRQFHFSEDGWNYTRRRHNHLTPYGLALQHYSPAEVRRSSGWAREVELWLRARARELDVRYIVPRVRRTPDLHPRPLVVPDLSA